MVNILKNFLAAIFVGIRNSAIDQARLGLLFLRKGKWNNHQLISEKWVHDAHQPSLPNKNYGYMWWMNTDGEWKGVSPNVYYAVGFGGNYIVIDEANDLLVVTRWMDSDKNRRFDGFDYPIHRE